MKKYLEQILCLFLISTSVLAIDSGALDTSFSNDLSTAGWDLIFESGGAVFATDTKVDSLGRAVVVGSYRKNGETNYHPFVRRYLANGQLDTSFGNNGLYIYPLFNDNLDAVKVDISSATNTIFVAYNFINNSNDFDIAVFYLDSTTTDVLGLQTIAFDLGATADRKDDFLAGINVNPIPFSATPDGDVIIAAEVERNNANDTDFGIAKLNYFETSGTLTFDTFFSSDGLTDCFFDQAGGVGIDKAMTIGTAANGNYVVGGSTFEGNGVDSNGWNASFCEFDKTTGAFTFKWSTLIPGSTADDSREFLADFVIYEPQNGIEYLLVLTKEPEMDLSNKFDFAIRRYNRIFSNGNVWEWEVDTTFGSGPRHISRVGFVDGLLFPAATDDEPKRILVETKNQQILIAGTSNWTDTNNENFSHMALAKLNKDGSLNTSWGTNQSGKAYVTLDNSLPLIFKDSLTSIAQDKKSEKIYISGINIAAGNQVYGSIARVHNDLIFKSGF